MAVVALGARKQATSGSVRGRGRVGFHLPLWFEVSSLVVLSLVLLADLLLVVWRPHHPSVRESLLWVVFYVGLAGGFAALMFRFGG